MRINKFIATHTKLSRRGADIAITSGRVEINNTTASLGDIVIDSDEVYLDGLKIERISINITGILNKPAGYVVSRNGQGSKTIYDLLPLKYHHLNPVGRLDKNSSGLLLLSNDGNLANELTHPRNDKPKVYEIELDRKLSNEDINRISTQGIDIGDERKSKFKIESTSRHHQTYRAVLYEGRNRQIRRTFDSMNYKVIKLHRTEFGPYRLGRLPSGQFKISN